MANTNTTRTHQNLTTQEAENAAYVLVLLNNLGTENFALAHNSEKLRQVLSLC
jgi:hypothetical protein